jgi:AraC-like DNA-binding protein
MKCTSRRLYLLHADALFRLRVRRAAERLRFELVIVEDWALLRQAVQQAHPGALVIVDPYAGVEAARHLAGELQLLLRDFDTITTLAAFDVSLGRFTDLRTLGEWGVAEIISLNEHDALALAQTLRTVSTRPLDRLLEHVLSVETPLRTRSILRAAADTTALGGQTEEFARRLLVSKRTLHRRCESQGLPPPRTLLAWMRVLHAASLLDQPGRTVEDVALACGYAADSGLRRTLYDFMGVGPYELRRQGALATASRAFRRAIETIRPPAGEPAG